MLCQLCGLRVSAGALHQALARLAAAAAPTYGALVEGVRASAAVAADETGWRVAGIRQWLWVFAGDQVTVYLVAAGGAATSRPRACSAPTSAGCWSATGGRPTGASRTPAIRAASRICCAGPAS